MVFTIVNSIEFTFRKYENMKMAIWHITTHFMVEGHKCGSFVPDDYCIGISRTSGIVCLISVGDHVFDTDVSMMLAR